MSIDTDLLDRTLESIDALPDDELILNLWDILKLIVGLTLKPSGLRVKIWWR